MAYEIPGFSFTLPAGENIANQFRFVTLSTGTVLVSDDGEWCIGVNQNTPNTGQATTVVCTGVSMVEAGAAITAGAAIAADSVGRAKTAATADLVVGLALEAAGAAGTYIAVLLTPKPAASA